MSEPSTSSDSLHQAAGWFTTTSWTVVVAAGQGQTPEAEAALEQLCGAYWYPLYAFVRRQGHGPQDAQDLTQAFFARLLEKRFVAQARQDKGRFRTFLLVALKRFLANEWDRQHAQRRGGFRQLVPIDVLSAESRWQAALSDAEAPDRLYERQWAITLLERVMSRLEEEYVATGRATLFGELRESLAKETSARPYAELAGRLQLTEAAVKMAVQRLRARYRELLREEIGRTVASPEAIEDELRHLFSQF